MIFDSEDYSALEWDPDYTRHLETYDYLSDECGDGGIETNYGGDGEEYGDGDGDGTGNGFEEFLIESYYMDFCCNGTGNGYFNSAIRCDGNGVGAGLARQTVRRDLLELAEELR